MKYMAQFYNVGSERRNRDTSFARASFVPNQLVISI